jgi:hypothetical protein
MRVSPSIFSPSKPNATDGEMASTDEIGADGASDAAAKDAVDACSAEMAGREGDREGRKDEEGSSTHGASAGERTKDDEAVTEDESDVNEAPDVELNEESPRADDAACTEEAKAPGRHAHMHTHMGMQREQESGGEGEG